MKNEKQMIDEALATSSASFASSQCATWEDIPWEQVERRVIRLQMRIAKAIREQRYNKAKALQWLLTHSHDAKLLAVKRVTESRGSRTPGVDRVTWRSPKQKFEAAQTLVRRGYQAQPLRRVYIPKRNGKPRPLGIPTMKDRAMQALYLLSLEPISETQADPNAYGFRPMRSTADAVQQCFIALGRKDTATWILEGDIKACFDKIDHQWLLANVHMDKVMLQKWLKAGYMENQTFHVTSEGTPQGGIISPCLAVIALSGLEKAVKQASSAKDKVNVVVYADDFIITGVSKEILQEKIKPVVVAFLKKRGLELSDEKTGITHIEEGFDFLGFNVRKYKGKMLIKPSKKNVKTFLDKTRETIRSNRAANTGKLIRMLNPKILGWANYFRHVVAKKTFSYVDNCIHNSLSGWIRRRHPKKNWAWRTKRYFRSNGPRNWVFFGITSPKKGSSQKPQVVELIQAKSVPIKRHIKIRSESNPYDPNHLEYLAMRQAKLGSAKNTGLKRMLASYAELEMDLCE